MIRISELRMAPGDARPLMAVAAERLDLPPEAIQSVGLVRQALDARRYRGAPIAFSCVLDVRSMSFDHLDRPVELFDSRLGLF